MSHFRRNFVPGGTYFFTLVTQDRSPIFASEIARTILRSAFQAEQEVRPFTSIAMVLLPDHLHCVWTLPDQDQGYSVRWRRIKARFTLEFLAQGGQESTRSVSKQFRHERGIWQRRFWEHTIRDEDDLIRCVDYIHWNPVKHGYASRPVDYQWTTFHQYVSLGFYESLWGSGEVTSQDFGCAEWE